MKALKIILAAMGLLAGFNSCEKNEPKSSPLASLNAVTAIVGGGNVKLNTNERDSARAYNAKIFGIVPGNEIKLFRTSNSAVVYYKETPATENGGLYSIFLAGQGSTFEPIFKKENIPAMYTDNTIGVRIVNLSPNSTPVNITLQNNTGTNVFSSVTYKQITDFVKFPLPTTVPAGSVSFQVRAAANPTVVLATYTLPTSANGLYPGITVALQRNKNISIVIKGLMGTTTGPDAFGVFPVVASY